MTNSHLVNGKTINYVNHPGKEPGLFLLPGLGSHSAGTKATAIIEHCKKHGIACTSLDYSGHGASSGEFMQSTLSNWIEEALAIFDLTKGKKIIFGASIGFCIGSHLALKRKNRVVGMLGVGAAVDVHLSFPVIIGAEHLKTLFEKGWVQTSPTWGITVPQYQDYFKNSLFDKGTIKIACPIRLIYGALDPTISPLEAITLPSHYASENITSTLVKGGDHNLLRPSDLAFILQQLDGLYQELS